MITKALYYSNVEIPEVKFLTGGYEFSLLRLGENVFYDAQTKELITCGAYEVCWKAMKAKAREEV